MKGNLVSGAAVLALLIPVVAPEMAVAEEDDGLIPGEFAANVALTSDYTFRGISQTDEEPALQGGFDYSLDTGFHDTGIYLGVWGSNVDFDDGDEAQLELDVYGGLSGEIVGVGWKLGGIGYLYPGADDSLNYNYAEVTFGLSYAITDDIKISTDYFYSPNFFADVGNGHYWTGGVSVGVPLPDSVTTAGFGLTLVGAVGHQWIEDNNAAGVPDYTDWRIGAAVTYKFLSLGVAYVDTNLSDGECFGGSELCGARVVGTLAAAF